jgi:ribosomal protein S18 acetylase RimI-like enzyme
MEKVTLREYLKENDKSAIKNIVEKTTFFTEEEIAIALSLVDEYLDKGESSGYYFLVILLNKTVVGYSCYGPIPATKNGYDLYWIAVDPTYQNLGFGATLLQKTEQLIVAKGGKRLYAETSSTPKYNSTRNFYTKNDFVLEAIQKEYYNDGDDKFLYIKNLAI